MHEWTPSEALRTHMECVAACMAAYARRLAPHAIEIWRVTGIPHDFDYERHPSQEEHPFVGVEHLRSLGVEEPILLALLGRESERPSRKSFLCGPLP